jgi:outer membrane protein OmpA-like peptidoglycan-associated protein
MTSLIKTSAALLLGSLTLALSSSATHAQDTADAPGEAVTLDRYSASENIDDGFHLSRPDDQGDGQLGAMVHFDYANDPLVLELSPGNSDTEEAAVVGDQVVAHVRLSLGLWDRLVLFGGIDGVLVMAGDSYRDPVSGIVSERADGAGLGDGRFGARVRLVGEKKDVFGLALQASATFPLARLANDEQRFSGEESVTILPELLFELRPGKLRITGNLGAPIRADAEFGRSKIADELAFGAGATYPLAEDTLDAILEVYGATAWDDFAGRSSSPVEAILGGKLHVTAGCTFGLAAGPGLLRGLGSPDFRGVALFGCVTRKDETPPPIDTDGDGFLDPSDGCPLDPEDKDKFEDQDGCSDPDNDKDGILDKVDACPLEPEDTDDFEDENGCPDPDNDKDGILDTDDSCPLEPEDTDDFEDQDGCVDPDNDKDGILDRDDECVMEPEDLDGFEDENGCPEAGGGKVKVTCEKIDLGESVYFDTNKDVIQSRSFELLDQVVSVLNSAKHIKRVRVEGHTDSQGSDKKNLELSKRRAASVMRYLTEHGVDQARLESEGFGETKPIDDNKTKDGRANNRRVELVIVEQDSSCKE